MRATWVKKAFDPLGTGYFSLSTLTSQLSPLYSTALYDPSRCAPGGALTIGDSAPIIVSAL